MVESLHRWLGDLSLDDPLERQQARLLQVMLLFIIGACLIGLPLSLVTASNNSRFPIGIAAYGLLIPCNIGALALLRRGRFTAAVYLASLSIILTIGMALVATENVLSPTALVAFTIPVALAGLLLGRRGILLAAGLSIAFVVITATVNDRASEGSLFSIVATFALELGLLSLLLDRFGNSLRRALATARAREQELESLRASLEATVAERTASLQQALDDVEQRENRLAQIVEDLRASQETVRELSAPVIPVLRDVLVAPLVGALDSGRAAVLTGNVLEMVEREGARYVIFDVTGVPLVDTQVAQVLLQTTAAVRLLGARAMLAGIRPEVAQTLVALNVDLSAISTYPNLRAAVGALLAERPNDASRMANGGM
jgi:anti-anti-sigma regulatory factor